jgi:beta-lactamase regulating signal transducer with metallopeptidase domain
MSTDAAGPSGIEAHAAAVGSTLGTDGLFFLAWLMGSTGLLGYLAWRGCLVRRGIARARVAHNEPLALMRECCVQTGVGKSVWLRLSEETSSPSVCGWFRPGILIPEQLVEKLSVAQLRAVLLHELVHIKRGDLWVNHAQTLLQIVYWWHPMVWLANAHVRRLRELAVDERVMVELGRDAEAYPATLLEVARLALNRARPTLGLIGIFESKSALAHRVNHLVNGPVSKSSKLSAASLGMIIIVGALLIPMAKGQIDTIEEAPLKPIEPRATLGTDQAGMTKPAVMVEAKILAVPPWARPIGAETFQSQSGRAGQAGPPGVFNAEGVSAILQFYRSQGIEPLSSPRVVTADGQQATVSVSKAGIKDGQAVLAGMELDVTPRVEEDSINLKLRLRVGNLSDSGGTAISHPPSDPFDVSSTFVLATNINVPKQMSAVVGRPTERDSPGTNYLFLVTPQLVDPSDFPAQP